MNPTKSLLMALLILLLAACQSDKKPAPPANSNAATPLVPPAPSQNSAVATAGVQHYICPNNCAGSGAAQAGTCPVCGTQYVHNAAFHNQPGAAAGAGNSQLAPAPILTNPQPIAPPSTAPVQQTQVAPQQQEPAQNAAGVWHYVCSKGCAGGSGTRGYCSKCGAGLDHNPKYHQQ